MLFFIMRRNHYTSKTSGLFSTCLVVAVLYFARDVFVPLALATLLAFLLEPLVRRLELCHLGRTPSVLLAIVTLMVAGAALGLVVSSQLSQLNVNLPQYKDNIHKRLQQIREANVGSAARALKSIQDIPKELTPTNSPPSNSSSSNVPTESTQKPIPVEIHDENQTALKLLQPYVSPSLSFLLKLVLVAVFCIFILIGRDDLRTRLIRIAGPRNMNLTLNFLVEADSRLSRYLLTQAAVNICYGTIVGLALWAIGLPVPVLWGISAALLRYIPYVGAWIAVSMPVAIALAIAPGWAKPLMVLVVFATLEIVIANFLEPWLYGKSAGITPFAVLLAAVFWTWLWGPVGLLLSMPLTVALASFARYFPELEIIDQLFAKSAGSRRKSPEG